MSHKATDWAWEQPVRGVRQHVLLALADRANVRTRRCSPSMGELMARTGLAENTIRSHIKALVSAGLVAAEVSNGGRRKRSTYTVLVGPVRPETPQEMQGFEGVETPQEMDRSEGETPQEMRKNPSGDAPVVLRTKTRTREPGSTSDAAASADEPDGLFAADPTPPVQAGRELAVIGRKELAQTNAGDAVAAWHDGFVATHDAKPTARQLGQVGREARQLLEAGNPPERVLAAARAAGERGFPTVERQYRDLASRRPGPVAPPRASTTDARVNAGLALAAKYAQQEAAG